MKNLLGKLLLSVLRKLYMFVVSKTVIYENLILTLGRFPKLLGFMRTAANLIESFGPSISEDESDGVPKEFLSEDELTINKRINAITHGGIDIAESHSISRKPLLAIVGPLPGSKSGVGQYSLNLARKLATHYSILLVVEQINTNKSYEFDGAKLITPKEFLDIATQVPRVVYHIGNSPSHVFQIDLLEKVPGIVDCHDFFLSGLVGHRFLLDPNSNFQAKWLISGEGYKSLSKRTAAEITGGDPEKLPISSRILQLASHVIFHGENALSLLQKYYPSFTESKFSVVPLASKQIDLRNHNESAPREAEPISSAITISSFGFITENKACIEIVKAAGRVALRLNREINLNFVGENDPGDYGQKLNAEILKTPDTCNVKITGWLDEKEYIAHTFMTDFSIQLRLENFGESSAAALDATLFGRPLIVNDIGAFSSIGRSSNVRVIPQISVEAIERAMLEEISALNEPQPFNYQLDIEGSLTMEVAAERYREIIEEQLYVSLEEKNAVDRNLKNPRRRHLFVDVTDVANSDRGTGIQRVVKEFVKQWLDNEARELQICPVYYCSLRRRYIHAIKFTSLLMDLPELKIPERPVDYYEGDVFLGLDLISDNYYENSLAVMQRNGVKIFFVVYDLLPVELPQYFPKTVGPSFERWLKMISKFNGAFCISNDVALKLDWYISSNIGNRDDFRINTISLGSDFDARLASEEIQARAASSFDPKRDRPIFLMVGTIEPRKGHIEVLSAFESLWSAGLDFQLQIVGKQGWMTEDFCRQLESHPRLGDTLLWVRNASDADLEKIYKAADCLIVASYGEGFGLPIVEAAQRGLPIICRDIDVFREVARRGATYFGGFQGEDLAQTIKRWTAAYQKNKLPNLGLVKQSTWQESAEKFMSALLDSREFSDGALKGKS